MPIKAPYLPYPKLRELADQFLDRHHADRSLPVPIESIIEFDFEMQVIPVPGLMNALHIDASISSCLGAIYVDDGIYRNRENRYRFSLAHELAHRILHKEIFEQLKFNTFAEWKEVVGTIPEQQYGYIEYQAYCFAGLVLVPGNRLQEEYELLEDQAAEDGIILSEVHENDRGPVESNLARTFRVSPQVIRKRMAFDNRW